MGYPVATRATDDLINAAIWNADLVANMNGLLHLIARTPSDVSRTSTTLANDATLFTPSIPANEVWQFQFVTLFNTSSNDPKVAVTFPSGDFTGTMSTVTINASLVGSGTTTNTLTPDLNNNDPGYPSIITAVFENGGTPGPVTFQWASSAGVAVILNNHSTLWGVRLA
jgi:hypothetical protein